MISTEQYELGDRVEVLGHDRDGVIVGLQKDGDFRTKRMSVATLNRYGDRVVYDLSPEEVEKRG